MEGTNFNCINQGKISHWGRGSSSSDKQLETQQKSSKFIMHQPPLPPPFLLPCNYWLVPNPTSKLREQNVSIQFLKFPIQLSDPLKSDIFRNLGGLSHFLKHFLEKRSDHYSTHSTLPQSIGLLRSFAESLSCHLSRLFSSSSHVSIVAPILPFINRPRPASMGWILSVWFSGSM